MVKWAGWWLRSLVSWIVNSFHSLTYVITRSKGLLIPWTMKSSQGPVKFVIGCWTRPGATLAYTKKQMLEWSRSLRSLLSWIFNYFHSITCVITGSKGLLTPWTMKSSQGPVQFVIGCWTRPMTTSVYTKEQMSEWPRSLRSLVSWIFNSFHIITYVISRSKGCLHHGPRSRPKAL